MAQEAEEKASSRRVQIIHSGDHSDVVITREEVEAMLGQTEAGARPARWVAVPSAGTAGT